MENKRPSQIHIPPNQASSKIQIFQVKEDEPQNFEFDESSFEILRLSRALSISKPKSTPIKNLQEIEEQQHKIDITKLNLKIIDQGIKIQSENITKSGLKSPYYGGDGSMNSPAKTRIFFPTGQKSHFAPDRSPLLDQSSDNNRSKSGSKNMIPNIQDTISDSNSSVSFSPLQRQFTAVQINRNRSATRRPTIKDATPLPKTMEQFQKLEKKKLMKEEYTNRLIQYNKKKDKLDFSNKIYENSNDMDDADDAQYTAALQNIKITQTDLNGSQFMENIIRLQDETKKEFEKSIVEANQKFNQHVQETQLSFKQDKIWNLRNFIDMPTGRLSLDQIQFIQNQYSRPQEARDYLGLNNLLKDIKFFSQLAQGVRAGILFQSEFVHLPANSVVFKQGDFGDQMYIILRGSCNIIVLRHVSFSDDPIQVQIASIYDGQQFGELSMMGTQTQNLRLKQKEKTVAILSVKINDNRNSNQSILTQNTGSPNQGSESVSKASSFRKQVVGKKADDNQQKVSFNDHNEPVYKKLTMKELYQLNNQIQKEVGMEVKKDDGDKFMRTKRAATVRTAENTFMLSLPRQVYTNVLLNSIQEELDRKLRTLMMAPFFKDLEPFQLIPLADVVMIDQYQFGDYILKKDEKLTYIGFIAVGQANVIYEERQRRPLNNGFIGKQRKFFKYRQICDPQTKMTIQGERQGGDDEENNLFYISQSYSDQRTFVYGHQQKLVDEKQLEYTNHVVFQTFTTGDVFGGRIVFTSDDYLNQQQQFPKWHLYDDDSYREYAHLPLVSNSNDMEVFRLDLLQFYNLPEIIQNQLKKGLTEYPEFDQHEIQNKRGEYQLWHRYKKETVDRIFIQREIRKNFVFTQQNPTPTKGNRPNTEGGKREHVNNQQLSQSVYEKFHTSSLLK